MNCFSRRGAIDKTTTNVVPNHNSEDWDEWIDAFPWQWLCTLKLRPNVTISQADGYLHAWLPKLTKELGSADVDWLIAPALGSIGFDYHFHILIGGLREWGAAERLLWMRRWFEMAGEARIDEYKSKSRRVHYIFKTIEGDELEGHDCPLCSLLL